MFRLLAKQNAQRVEYWRNGVRMRYLGVSLADGSFLKLLPNRPVEVSDAVMDLNKSLLDSPYVVCTRLCIDKSSVVTAIEDVKESIVVIPEIETPVQIDIIANDEAVIPEPEAVSDVQDVEIKSEKVEDKKRRRR